MQSMIFKVRPTKEAEFAKLVKKFNRCLKASGMREIQPVLLGRCSIDIKTDSTNLHYSVEGNQYQLSFPDEVLGMKGYRFIGEYRKLDGKWHRTMHSDDIRDELEVNEGNLRCDHCGRNITNRNGYFFFRDPEGKLTVVGSTCVDAFLGFNVRDLLLALGDATVFDRAVGQADLEKEVIGIGIESFISLVSEATGGFACWKRNGQDGATSPLLKSEIFGLFNGTAKPLKDLDNAAELVETCRKYWSTVYKFDDFTVNSRKALQGSFVPLRWAGIAGFAAYKAVSDSRKQKTEPPAKQAWQGNFVGRVGEAMTSLLTPRKYFAYTNKWGNGWAVHFDDAAGNHYLTFTSSNRLMDAVRNSIGTALNLSFTVSGQELDRGRNVNKIKRVAEV